MIRRIIKIDSELCNGCGACAAACHEGAIEMVDGKARLTREDYCDGLGDCLPACPTGAIRLGFGIFKKKEAASEQKSSSCAGSCSSCKVADTLGLPKAPTAEKDSGNVTVTL